MSFWKQEQEAQGFEPNPHPQATSGWTMRRTMTVSESRPNFNGKTHIHGCPSVRGRCPGICLVPLQGCLLAAGKRRQGTEPARTRQSGWA